MATRPGGFVEQESKWNVTKHFLIPHRRKSGLVTKDYHALWGIYNLNFAFH